MLTTIASISGSVLLGIQVNDNKISNWKQEGVCDHDLSGATSGLCHHHSVTSNYFVHDEPSYGGGIVGSCAISTINVSDYVFANNVCEITRAGSAVTLNGLRSVIANNIITSGASAGIVLAQGTDSRYDTSESIITGNIVRNMDQAGIHAQNAYPGHDLIISNNIVDRIVTPSFGGIVVQDWENVTIVGNIAKNCVGPGIETTGSITLSGMFNLVISNNICYNNGMGLSATAEKRAGISVYGATSGTVYNAGIYNNLCFDDQSSGTQRYGIRMKNTVNAIVKNNDVRRNTTSGISLTVHSGTVIFGNLGYVTENKGIYLDSGNASTTLYSFPHGLDVSAESGSVAVTPLSRQAISGPGFIVSGGVTNISVTYLAAPVSGDVKLGWSVAA